MASSLVSAGTLIVSPAHAVATGHAGCPTPTKAEAERSEAARSDQPPRGATAIDGLLVNHIPKGFSLGQVVVDKHDGMSEYGYQWTDTRDEVDRKHRALWVRVVCWPDARKLSGLRDAPFHLGTFSGDPKTAKIGGREVLTQEGDGALGHGRYVGWVERKGTVVTVMAGRPLVPELNKIIKGIRLP
ncbi:hypothetical protein Aros01_06016 [Streptosporangium roseum]|uniref:DUF4367 domain-containing protein n=1 Tax=Streptosporangium roseum (strain ATCC 12428 / DSM 43021 / JCM 3005 / KCTC 9067 / NCIMB 10171 / NRRL 2505 / NI 9100) TaxID=479432 RepID=D2B3X8_STRRD|nr:hypothetical protein Sros_6704 [Streptosporangium roseum DSM 43021]